MNQSGVLRAALVLGIEGRGSDLGEPDLGALASLTDAPKRAKELAEALSGYDYRPLAASVPKSTARLEKIIDRALKEPGFVVVHVVTHGIPTRHGRPDLRILGPDRKVSKRSVAAWLDSVEEDRPHPEPVLFILDVCHAGTGVDVQIQQLVRAEGRKAFVLAASAAKDPAYDCRLTQAVTQVLKGFAVGDLQIDATFPHIPFGRFCAEVDRALAALTAGSYPQQLESTPIPVHLDRDSKAFFPNLNWEPRDDVRDRLDPGFTALLDEGLDPRHFIRRAASSEPVFDQTGRGFFHGRGAQLQALRDWATSTGPQVRVVTGKPGSGKSALLGVFVCAAHPSLRDHTTQLWSRLSGVPPRMADGRLAVVHARRRTTADVCSSIARQWNLPDAAGGGEWTPELIVTALRDAVETEDDANPHPYLVLVDAVDEAERPEDLTAALLIPLADAQTSAGDPLCRLAIGVRPEPRFSALIRRAGAFGLIDLGTVPASELRPAVAGYVEDLLTAEPPYDDVTHAAAARALADAVAEALTGASTDGEPSQEWGEFLVAGLFVRHLLNLEPVRDAVQARELGGSVPRDLRGVLDLDLARRDRPGLLLAVATALAFAEGTGMPERILQRVTAAVTGGHALNPSAEPPSLEDLREALQELRFYLRRDVDEDGSTLYRLFHQGLADQLIADAERGGRGPALRERIWAGLLMEVS